jgi:hypothetical protein
LNYSLCGHMQNVVQGQRQGIFHLHPLDWGTYSITLKENAHKFIDIVFELHKPDSNHCSWIGNLVSLHFTAWWTWTMVIIVQEALNSNSPNGHLYLLTSNSIHTKCQFHKNCYAFAHGRFIELQETVNGSYYNPIKFLLKKNQWF